MILEAALFFAGFAPQEPKGTLTLHEELAQLIALPTTEARQAAADKLAQKNQAPLEQWLAACRTFGTFATQDEGPSRHMAELQVLDKTERTELHLFVPKGYDGKKPMPLLLWGHGAAGTGAREYLLWEEVANRVGLVVLAPTEFGNPQGWGYTPRERQSPLEALRWARREVNVDENAIFVGGWSRGGHMAWDLMLRHPDLFAGALPCVGGPRMELGPRNNLRYLENVAHLPIRDLQGSAGDDALLMMNLRLAFARLQKFGATDAVFKEFPDRGHDADLAAVDWADFFTRRRAAKPQRIVRMAAEPTENRAAWATITAFDERVAVDFAPQVGDSYNRLDEAKKRAVVLDRLLERTARLVVQDKGKGLFVADGKGVKSFTLLLDESMIGKDGNVEVRWLSKPVRKKVTPDVAVLLREFAERFDRTFLPVAQVTVP